MVINFDEAQQLFLLCRQCRTHIALLQDLALNDISSNVGVFNNAVNVEVAGEAQYRVKRSHTVADVYCINCHRLLGQTIIAVEQEDPFLRQGSFLLEMTKLLMWDGNRMVYGHTFEPVEDA